MNSTSQIQSAGLRNHPFAELFPMMEGNEYAALVADIRENGLFSPVTVIDDMILDGRNRYRACLDAGVMVQQQAYLGDDPLGFVIAANLRRRHLDESQRSMIAEKLANMRQGERTDLQPSENLPKVGQVAAARLLNVSDRSLRFAKVVRATGTPELVRRVERGEVAVSLAADVARLPKEVQPSIASLPPEKLRSTVTTMAKQEKRAERETELVSKTEAASRALGTKVYSVIMADPPWRFEPYSRDTGMDRAADNHYPTMTLDGIKQLKVPAAPDCVLFLWATAPMLPEALDVMRAWGFEYRSQFVWAKDRAGTGYWTRNQHELLLICVKGHVPAPAPGQQFSSVIEAAVGEHSAKPPVFAEMIEEMFPNQTTLEMFARAPRLGWDVWGNEAS